MNNIIDIRNIINIKILKCFRILFTKEGIKNNIGSYILLSIIFINLFLFFIFLIKGYKKIYDLIEKIIPVKEKIINKDNNNDFIYKRNNKRKKKKNKTNQFNEKIINNNIIKDNKKKKKKKKNKKEKNEEDNLQRSLTRNINIMNTNKEDIFSNSKQQLNRRKINNINLSKLKINSINKTKNENIKFNDYELDTLNYEQAIKYDKRNYIQYYISLLKRKQLLIFSFYTYNDYNSKIIKICLFFFSFSLYYTVNALFFNDSNIHRIYEDQGKFNFIYQISQIFYSSLICSAVNIIITSLSLSEKNIISLKNKDNNNIEKISSFLKCLKIKFFLFFLLKFIFLILFWYYISCFCAVYKNSQIHLIKDTLISFGLSMLYPFALCILPGIFRIPALRANKSDKECLYKFSKILQLI